MGDLKPFAVPSILLENDGRFVTSIGAVLRDEGALMPSPDWDDDEVSVA